MKNLLLIMLAIISWGCNAEKKEAVNTSDKTPPKKETIAFPITQKTINKERINEELITVEITYQLDTFYLAAFKKRLIKPKGITVNISPKEMFPASFKKDLAININKTKVYNTDNLEKKLASEKREFEFFKKDLNFDGKQDIYFAKEGVAQNTSYVVYLYNSEKKQYQKQEELSKMEWAKLELEETNKELILYNHFSAKEGYKTRYSLDAAGNLKLVARTGTIRLKDRKLHRVTGAYKNGVWVQDTVLIEK